MYDKMIHLFIMSENYSQYLHKAMPQSLLVGSQKLRMKYSQWFINLLTINIGI